jgi:hypothetical protein
VRLIVVVAIAAVVLLPLATSRGGADPGFLPGSAALGAFLVMAFGLLLVSGGRRDGREARTPAEADRRYLATIVLVGLAARVAIAVALRRLGLDQVIAPDEETFHINGLQFSRWLEGETPYRLSIRHLDSLQVGYFYLIGGIYYLFGVAPMIPVILNCIVGAVTAIPVFGITRDLAGREAARPAALLVTFFPSVVLWSTLLIRDTLVIFLLLLVIESVMALRRGFTIPRLVRFLVVLAALGTFRQYLFVILAGTSVMSFVLGRAGRTGRSFGVGVVVLLGLFLLVKLAGFGLWELERASLFHLNQRRQFNALPSAAGSIAPEVDISEPVSALTYLPVGMVYFLGSPFPWQVLNARQIMAVPDVLVWYLLLPPIFFGLVHIVRRRFRDGAMLLLSITTITVLYSLVEGNVGIIFRHRAQIIVPMMVFAGAGIALRRARREEARAAAVVPVGATA